MNPEGVRLKILKIMLITAAIWSAVTLLSARFSLLDAKFLDLAVNVFELAYGFASGILLMLFARSMNNGFRVKGTALAIFSWTLGQIFWFSYTRITGDSLPYPSIGDMGYTGTYLLLIGVMGLIPAPRHASPKRRYRLLTLVILAAPVIVLLSGRNKIEALIYNFILASAAAVALFKVSPLLKTRKYRIFAAGVILLGAADFAFMMSVGLSLTDTFVSDALYTVSIALISYGIAKGGLTPDD